MTSTLHIEQSITSSTVGMKLYQTRWCNSWGEAIGADAPSGEINILNENNLIFSVNKF